MLVKQINAQSFTSVLVKTNNFRLAVPSNFLYFSLVAGSNITFVPTNFGDGTWGLIINSAGSSSTSGPPALLLEDSGYLLLEDGGHLLLE